jgi:hypothetical protein
MRKSYKKIFDGIKIYILLLLALLICVPVFRNLIVRVSAKSCGVDQIMLVLDKSDSMTGDDLDPYPTREAALKDISKNFVNTINFAEDKVGVVLFSDKYELAANMGASKTSILNIISSYSSDHGTMIDGALALAQQNMPGAISGGDRYMVLVTDGQQDDDTQTINLASQIKSKGIILATLAMGDKTDAGMLKSIATPGYAYSAASGGELNKFYDLIGNQVKCGGTPATPAPSGLPATPTPTPTYKLPEFDSYEFVCSEEIGAAYTYDFAADIYAYNGSKITKVYAVFAPTSDSNGLYSYSGGVVTGPMSQSVNVPSYTTITSTDYSILGKSPSKANIDQKAPTFKFTIDFLSNTPFFQTFNAGIDLYMYVEDSTGANNLNVGKLKKVAKNFKIPSSDDCDHLYFTTSNGDFRSHEIGAYAGKLGTDVMYNVEGNKYWQTQNDTRTAYSAFANGIDEPVIPRSSSYTFEAESSVLPRSTQNYPNNFNVDLNSSNLGIRMDRDILKNFSSSVFNSAYTTKNLNVYELNSSDSNYPGKVNYDTGKREITIDLADVTVDNTLIVFNDNAYENVVIADSNGSSENKIIIWCRSKSCNLKVKPVGKTGTFLIDKDKVTYDEASVKSKYLKRSRIFLNYDQSDSAPMTPIDSIGTYGSVTIPSTRVIELLSGNDKVNNFYVGSFLTNGFLVSSHSEKTDIIKGLVHTRGTIVNSTDRGTANAYFKDFPNPFLHIDFDPKYHIEFKNILFRSYEISGAKYVGI